MVVLPVFDQLTIKSYKGEYSVVFDDNALSELNNNVPENTHFIIDKNVAELYKKEMENILNSPSVLIIEALEENKSLDKFTNYVEHLVSRQARRGHSLYAIGGGIIQDITAFLATTLFRGVDWKFLPTTLLAQSDSCIGSKSSINVGEYKNLLGTFTPPKEIKISTKFLDTLNIKDVRSGVGEMLKVHGIDGPESFAKIAADYDKIFEDRKIMMDYIRKSLVIKKHFIEADEFDENIRNVMNYGHSFGHAVESATNFEIPHGTAVTLGMDMANYTSWQLGLCDEKYFRNAHPVLQKNYKEFIDMNIPEDKFLSAISKDKKNTTTHLTLILLDKDGKVFKGPQKNDDNFQRICHEFIQKVRKE